MAKDSRGDPGTNDLDDPDGIVVANVDVLAAIHAVDPDEAGLDDLGLLMIRWNDAGDGAATLVGGATVLESLPTKADLGERYAKGAMGNDAAGWKASDDTVVQLAKRRMTS